MNHDVFFVVYLSVRSFLNIQLYVVVLLNETTSTVG